MQPNLVNTLYDTDYAKAYNERYLTNPYSAVSMEVELATLRRVLHRDSRWLDLGCGTGFFLSRFPDIQRAGLDISPEMLKVASHANPGALFFREGDFRMDVPEWKMAWSVVSCMWAAYSYVDSIKEVEQVISNMINWCKPGGAIFIPVVDLEDVRPNQQLSYKEATGVFGGAIYLTGVTWTWVEEAGEKVHTHLVAPHVEHFVELLKSAFDNIEIIRYPPYQAGWVSRKAVLATGRRHQADPLDPAKVVWQPIPPPVTGSANSSSPLAFLTYRQLLGELFRRIRSGSIFTSLRRKLFGG